MCLSGNKMIVQVILELHKLASATFPNSLMVNKPHGD